MEIKRAKVLGFCFGVRRAVELAENALEQNKTCNSKVYSLGPLIHNEMELKLLEEKGLHCIEENEIENISENSVVIIRAHGVGLNVITKLEEKKCKIIDATCPRVKSSQKMVERYTKNNDYVVLTGDKNHGEVIGIAGYAGKNFSLVQNYEEALQLKIEESDKKNVILMSQTTYSINEFEKIEKLFTEKYKNLAVMNTICPATNERQSSLIELCKEVEGVIVVGGKSSANTKRLYQTAEKNCKKAVFIQCAEEIPDEFYKLNKIGITAGASTPDSIINKVEEELLKVK